MDCAGYQIWLRDVYDGMLNLPARPREQQETGNRKYEITVMTMPLI
jgi:hypothetical protein